MPPLLAVHFSKSDVKSAVTSYVFPKRTNFPVLFAPLGLESFARLKIGSASAIHASHTVCAALTTIVTDTFRFCASYEMSPLRRA